MHSAKETSAASSKLQYNCCQFKEKKCPFFVLLLFRSLSPFQNFITKTSFFFFFRAHFQKTFFFLFPLFFSLVVVVVVVCFAFFFLSLTSQTGSALELVHLFPIHRLGCTAENEGTWAVAGRARSLSSYSKPFLQLARDRRAIYKGGWAGGCSPR